MPRSYAVSVPQEKIDAILTRVKDYPWYPAPVDEGDTWLRGTNTEALRALCDYWVDGFDWRACEAELNRFPQFIETIEGIDIHYVHMKGEGENPKPIILTHGWPGSHFEFWNVIERLAHPSKFGGDPKDAFDVVVPSLPGFGFSGKPDKPIGPKTTARLWNSLMTQTLGYSRYIAQGGDLGALVTPFVALDYEACTAIHLNMIAVQPADPTPHTEEETAWFTTNEARRPIEGAYLAEHTTKPQTIGMALADTPVGTASWIFEKVVGWTDLSERNLAEVYSKDEILTTIMIYLVNDAIASSIWFYADSSKRQRSDCQQAKRLKSQLAWPSSWASRYSQIRPDPGLSVCSTSCTGTRSPMVVTSPRWNSQSSLQTMSLRSARQCGPRRSGAGHPLRRHHPFLASVETAGIWSSSVRQLPPPEAAACKVLAQRRKLTFAIKEVIRSRKWGHNWGNV